MLSYQYFFEKGYKTFLSQEMNHTMEFHYLLRLRNRKHLKYFSPLYSNKNIKIRPHDPLHEKKKMKQIISIFTDL